MEKEESLHEMEALYAKLYNKYTKLKKEKESQFYNQNHDQEVKFLNFVAAADEMIQHLTSEKARLNDQVGKLQSELASVRSSNNEQHIHYEKLLTERDQENKELSEKIARLENLQHNECSHCIASEETGHGLKRSHEDSSIEIAPKKPITMSKKHKSLNNNEGVAATEFDDELEHPAGQHSYVDHGTGDHPSIQQPACCQRKTCSSAGGDATDTCSVSCVFQHLVEFIIGMKVSVNAQGEELCILAHHQSSGYLFSLTWITNTRGEEELLYQALSLGTFQRAAPDWMKETLMFSSSMCGVFFQRVTRVIRS